MELIIEEKQETQGQGLNPFKDFKLPTFTRKPIDPLLGKVEQNGKSGNNNQFCSTFPKSGNNNQFCSTFPKSGNNNQFCSTFPKSGPREPFKQPSYHQKYQQTYKQHSNSQLQPQQPQQSFSYDHILNSLHMKVKGGKLEYIPPNQNSLEKTKNKIINHYFQNQTHQQQQPLNQEPTNSTKRPMTREEHEKKLAYYYWQQHQQRKRIAEIKSKKMLYPTDHIQISRSNQKHLNFG